MKIRFLEDTYIRSVPGKSETPPIGIVYAGSEIEVKPDTVSGDALQENDQWYKDKNEWYYWSGRTEVVQEDPAPITSIGAESGLMALVEKTDSVESATPMISFEHNELSSNDEDAPQGENKLVSLLLDDKNIAEIAALLSRPTKRSLSNRATAFTFSENQPRPRGEKPPVFWQHPQPDKLNWALTKYAIASDWWQARRLTGRDIRLAILGTGIDPDHPDLVNLVGKAHICGMEMSDRDGLGTCAALAAAGCGHTIFGVAPEAQLLVGKIGEQSVGITPENLIAGLQGAIEARADIVSMLVAFQEINPEQQEEMEYLVRQAVKQGILLVAPVGASESNAPTSYYPAKIKGVLSVGSHDRYNQRSIFSARSKDLDLLVPGEDLQAFPPSTNTYPNLKSTSIAAAFAAGFLALLLQSMRERQHEVAPEKIYAFLQETAKSRPSFSRGENIEYGNGLLDPVEILRKLYTYPPKWSYYLS